ncbi:thiamine pyrophosphate-binding protein [Aurantiacibacter atlanticus]|uniref:thiamine pyrophosphate-binding protein n=1 Tax=Aurantiacibacter atlanticus TaxID=1648404 RepID=UPI00215019F6|nr:thiamine pyrophosphate-binding protein [Aurantiacibacter atlanticus]
MKASDLLVAALEAEGVEYIFAVPGEENLDLLESLRTSSIRLIVTRHEQGAGFMAATYGRLTGKAGVCLATLGPGATNLTTPAAYAALGAFPLVMITGQNRSGVRRQNIWHNSRRRIAECGPRLGLMFRRRACGVASADVRVSFA